MSNNPMTGAKTQLDWTPTNPAAAMVTLATYGRNMSQSDTSDFYDSTSYSEAQVTPIAKRTKIAGLGDGNISLDVLYQAGSVAIYNALAAGTTGNLVIRREGTGTGKPSVTYTGAIITERGEERPYDDLATLSCTWELSGVGTVAVQA